MEPTSRQAPNGARSFLKRKQKGKHSQAHIRTHPQCPFPVSFSITVNKLVITLIRMLLTCLNEHTGRCFQASPCGRWGVPHVDAQAKPGESGGGRSRHHTRMGRRKVGRPSVPEEARIEVRRRGGGGFGEERAEDREHRKACGKPSSDGESRDPDAVRRRTLRCRSRRMDTMARGGLQWQEAERWRFRLAPWRTA
jgi:hypothetical protein